MDIIKAESDSDTELEPLSNIEHEEALPVSMLKNEYMVR